MTFSNMRWTAGKAEFPSIAIPVPSRDRTRKARNGHILGSHWAAEIGSVFGHTRSIPRDPMKPDRSRTRADTEAIEFVLARITALGNG
jgi:hypothetical protein